MMSIDPDAPSRPEPTSAEILHWLAGNIPGGNLQRGDVSGKYTDLNKIKNLLLILCLLHRNC